MKLVKPAEWIQQGVDALEDGAWKALRETSRSVCVTASAGAGKTEFLAQKAAYLLQTGLCPHPKRILAISFKHDAARNLAERVALRCPRDGYRFVSLTFDAFTKGMIDQFRAAIPRPYRPPVGYQIAFPTRDSFQDFLSRHDAEDVDLKVFEAAIANTRLPLSDAAISQRRRTLLEAYWRDQLDRPVPLLSFAMINRSVEFLIRENAFVRRALQATYPAVFLDEFQDTTAAQFEVLTTAFQGGSSILTAVGDDKQRIMGWAGAMSDGFERFAEAFDPVPVTLLSNWRSHADLVAIQHLIARQIDDEAEASVPRRERQVDGSVAAIWQFRTRAEEIESLANWVAGEIGDGVVEPHRMAILVRNYADRVEQDIAPVFGAAGVTVRNVARNVGGVAIQDLLTESLTEVLMPFLRLAARKRDAVAWAKAQAVIKLLEAIPDDVGGESARLNRRTQSLARSAGNTLGRAPPRSASGVAIVDALIGEIGEATIRQATPSYARQADFDRIRSGVAALLDESRSGARTWTEVLDRFEGKGQVPLMTVHKSKGLEFHTILFLGLDDQTWWSLRPGNREELNSFFVAFTRAEQRAFFTCCSERGGRIAWLERVLGDAVPRVRLANRPA